MTKTFHQEGQLPMFEPPSTWTAPESFPELHGPQAWDTETCDPGLKTIGPGWFPGGEGYIAGISVATEDFAGYFPIAHQGGGNMDKNTVLRWAKTQLEKPGPKIFARAQYDVGWLQRSGINVRHEDVEDVQIQAPLLDEYRFKYDLDGLAQDYLGEGKVKSVLDDALRTYGLLKKKRPDVGQAWKLHARFVGDYAEGDALRTLALWQQLSVKIDEEELRPVYDLERSLVHMLVAMRMRGAPVDIPYAEWLRDEFRTKYRAILAELKHITGVQVDPWIVPTVAAALETQGITVGKTAKGQPSVTAEWLEGLANPVARLTLAARQYDRAAGTFVENYVLNHQRKGRIHATFEPLRCDDGGTVSGRFSCRDPNLENIPKRNPDIGPRVRAQFIGEEGEDFLSADYKSQEPRMQTHFAAIMNLRKAHQMAQAFRDNPLTDPHQVIADMCGIARKPAKTINLGLAYGMGGPKLCRSLGLPTKLKEITDRRTGQLIVIEVAGDEGQALLDRYDAEVPFVRQLMNKCANAAGSRGYIKTIMGRRARFPLVNGKREWTHKALNRLIQGSSADQTKIAMARLYYDHGVVPLNTVHDEVCFSVPKDGGVTARRYADVMEHALELEVPSIVDVKIGPSWQEKEED